ncbi:elongation factor TS-domain-containing protein [Phlyctochytrium arcticum]|nr:elongation factor TS-domain-containing protein [Phlyctochytrium arcticum]
MATIARFPPTLLLRNRTCLRSVPWASSRPAVRNTLRTFTTTLPTRASPATAIIAKLRKQTQCSISKAREALAASGGSSFEAALEWLEKDAATAGAKKAAKLGSRVAAEGLLGLCQVGNKAALVEFNSETDFVARSKEFVDLVQRTAVTSSLMGEDFAKEPLVAFLLDIDTDPLLECPLLPDPAAPALPAAEFQGKTVKESILETIGKLGENIKMRRALVTNAPDEDFRGSFLFAGGYVHSADSSLPSGVGRLGSLVVLESFVNPGEKLTEAERAKATDLAKKLAQHITGFSPTFKTEEELDHFIKKDLLSDTARNEGESEDEFRDRVVLDRQPFLFGGGSVEEVLSKHGAEVADFVRWECGEGIEKKEDNFAEEVSKQAGL